MILPTLQELGLEFSEIDSRAAIQFKGGETAAMQRLNHYFLKQKIFPSIKKLEMEWWKTYSSKFSAWLAMGCISPRTIYKEIRAYERENGANDSTYWLILNYYGVISFALCSKIPD
jgi:deoxyribodipyrimidine photo-lyase